MSELHVHVQTKIVDHNGDIEEWQHQYQGKLYIKNDRDYYLKYDENEEQSLGKTSTILKWNPMDQPLKIQIIRQGEVKSSQIFEEGKTNLSYYQSPYGTFEMFVSPSKVRIQSDHPNKGNIELEYDLEMDKQKIGRYQLTIQYHP